MNVRNSIKKVGAVAGSALMVGLTMGSAATLADFPQPFVDEDGMVQSQVVVGTGAKVADVVGAVNIAAAMGQSAVQTETQTASVSGASYGWSAADGQTLDTRNDNLYFGQAMDTVRQTLTQDHLGVLSETTFTDDAGTETDVTNYLNVGDQQVSFGNDPSGLDNADPVLHIPLDAENEVDDSNNLFNLQANFGDSLNFSDSDVRGEEIDLFGKSYTVAQGNDNQAGDTELVLLGSQEELSLEDGESGTITVAGADHTLEVVAVTGTDTAAFRVDGDLRQENTDGTFNLEGEQVRVDTIIQTNSQESAGLVTFAVGSEELTLEPGNAVQDDDGNDIDGTWVQFNGANSGETIGDVSSIDVYVGAANDDEDYVAAGELFSHSLFEQVEFHFGGLNPDAGDGEGDAVGEVVFSTTGDDIATVSFTTGDGDDTTVEFLHDDDPADATGDLLADNDDDNIEIWEGAELQEDEYFLTDAGDFAHMWEVTDISRSDSGANIDSDSSATIDLNDVASGSSVEVNLDPVSEDGTVGTGNDDYYAGTEIIDGQEYTFVLEGYDGTNGARFDSDSTTEFKVAWGVGVSDVADTSTTMDAQYGQGDRVSVYPGVDLDSGAALAFTEDVSPGLEVDADDGTANAVAKATFELPSTESSSTQTLTLWAVEDGTAEAGLTGDTYSYSVNGGTNQSVTLGTNFQVTVGQTDYVVVNSAGSSADALSVDTIGLAPDQQATGQTATLGEAAALVIQPQDDNDEEHAYVVEPESDDTEQVEVTGAGTIQYTASAYSPLTLDSDDDTDVDYNFFGTHTVEDTDEQGSLTLYIPDGQAVAGAAFTDSGGSLSAGGSSGSVTYEALAGMGALPDMARLDSEVTESVRSNNHLVLVGGPAVNTLVSTLVDEDSVDLSDVADAESGAVLQVVDDAFASGQHALVVAGYSADDTRSASRYLSNYADHEQALEDADSRMVLTEADYPSSQ